MTLAAASEYTEADETDLAEPDPATRDLIAASIPGGAANVQDIYPLAPLQEGLLYHHLTDEHDPYQQQAQFSFARREQLDAFAQALQQVIDRHDILRTSLVWEGLEQPMQVVWRQAPLRVEPLREGPAPLDLRRAPLMALDYAEEPSHPRWVARLRFHHWVNDATSTTLLMQEIRAHLLGLQAQLPTPVPYRNVVVQARSPARQAGHEAFFREQLGDVDEPTLAFGLQERQADRAHTVATAVDELSDYLIGKDPRNIEDILTLNVPLRALITT